MTTAVLLGLPLAFEPAERGIMRRPPRPPAARCSTRCWSSASCWSAS
jgi:hypothetical protein